MPVSHLLSSGQLAALIGRSRETIRRYEALGLIPAGRRDPINHRRYWPAEEAQAILQQLEPVTTKPSSASDRAHIGHCPPPSR
jgi:hypothetical protein